MKKMDLLNIKNKNDQIKVIDMEFSKVITLYHGSEFIIDKPEFGKGKINNDYGIGFYCTENIELSKEWSVLENRDGYSNKYELELKGLKILNLTNCPIFDWLLILMEHRTVELNTINGEIAYEYLLENFNHHISVDDYDIIVGYRADDSYFSFVVDFLNSTLSVQNLKQVMHAGNLGIQIVIKSKKAFDKLKYLESEKVSYKTYFKKKDFRDKKARDVRRQLLRANYNKRDFGLTMNKIIEKGYKYEED